MVEKAQNKVAVSKERQIAISNIAWSGEDNETFLDLVVSEGGGGIELAASLVWDEPVAASLKQRSQLRQMIESRGLAVVGLHALLFSRPDLQLLATGDAGRQASEYLRRTIDLCADLGGRCLVMGGSKNRRRGELGIEEAKRRGVQVMRELGEYAAAQGCYFALEALPPPVCDFVMNLTESEEVVSLAATSGLRLHFDSGSASVTEQGTSDSVLIELMKKVSHYHVNDFELFPPGTKRPEEHRRWARLLSTAGYEGWVSIEMRRSVAPAEAIQQAIKFVKANYLVRS